MRLQDVKTPADVDAVAEAMLGPGAASAPGVVHVTSAWPAPEGGLHALHIHPGVPRSRHDAFLLALARARADAIVTTGRILRDEPGVTHTVQGPARAALAAWRFERLGRIEPPVLLVLSSGRELPSEHPSYEAAVRPVLFVPSEAREPLQARMPARVAVHGDPEPSLRRALAWLVAEAGAERISVEAGPTTAATLYEDPPALDALWLARFGGSRPGATSLGPLLPSPARIAEALPFAAAPFPVEEESGPWQFQRFARLG